MTGVVKPLAAGGLFLAVLAAVGVLSASAAGSPTAKADDRPAPRQLSLNRSMAGIRVGDSVDRLHRVLGAPRAVDYVADEITGSLRIDTYGKLSFTSYGGSILSMKTARRSIRTRTGIGVGTTKRRLARELPGLSCRWHVCTIVAGGGIQTIGKRVTTFRVRNGKVRLVSIGRVID